MSCFLFQLNVKTSVLRELVRGFVCQHYCSKGAHSSQLLGKLQLSNSERKTGSLKKESKRLWPLQVSTPIFKNKLLVKPHSFFFQPATGACAVWMPRVETK